jgi:hypothetical protein
VLTRKTGLLADHVTDVAFHGKGFVSNHEVLLTGSLSLPNRPVPAPGPTYWAGFCHVHERERFDRLMTALDSAHETSRYGVALFVPASEQTPSSFPDNIASPSQTLSFVNNIEVQRTDGPVFTSENIFYRFRER